MLTSLALIALQRESLGSTRATFGDWPAMARDTLIIRFVAAVAFAAALAGVVQTVRYVMLRREHRLHTAEAIHRTSSEYERQ
jgi:hypothetical protein